MEINLKRKDIVIQKSPIHGYGVFAIADIFAGEIIEECYTLLSSTLDVALKNYFFEAQEAYAIPLGYGCIYNHSDQPNADYKFDNERQFFIFTAKKFIAKNEEILISYGNNWFSGRNFRKKEISFKYKLIQFCYGIPLRAGLVLIGMGLIFSALRFLATH